MDLEDLNKQMFALEVEFHNNQSNKTNQQSQSNQSTISVSNVDAVNFQAIKSPIDTTQIKRPTKSGEQRTEINDKMNEIKMSQYLPQNMTQNPPNTMPSFTRNNNTNYINSNQNQNANHSNHVTNYYSHNFDTLQNKKQEQYQNLQFQQAQQYPSQNSLFGMPNNGEENYNTHNNGINLLNVTNMYSMGQIEQTPNKLNDSGYTKTVDKKMDYRQNMNNKLDGFIFDNPIATNYNPILQNSSNINNINNMNGNQGMQKDTRMVIQDSSKDFYRQSANERMSNYSPMSRASNIPIGMASMTVNDFYSNMGSGNSNGNNTDNIFSNGFGNGTNNILTNESSKNTKDLLNNRMNEYTPLAKTIQLQQPAQQQNQMNQQTQNLQQSNQQQMVGLKPIPQLQRPPGSNPNGWGDGNTGVNGINGKLRNVVFNDLPIISN